MPMMDGRDDEIIVYRSGYFCKEDEINMVPMFSNSIIKIYI